jgi:predicted ATP-dependent endonuclease of OLD family
LTEIKIQNFRSFKDETILLDDYTCLVGPNGSGKSAVLMALNVFFRNNDATVTDVLSLAREDFHHENVQKPVRITITFGELPRGEDVSENARNLLELYARHGELVLFAEAKWNEVTQSAPVKQYGSRLVMEEFAPYFEAEKKKALVRDLRPIYANMRKKFPELPAETTGPQMRAALRNYEESLPKERKKLKDEPNELYGFTGGLYRLEDLVQWVYVPAVKDASTEQEEGSKTALGQLLQRTVRTKIDFKDELDALEEEAEAKYDTILEGKKGALKDLGLAIQESLRDWTNPRAVFELEWQGDFAKAKRPIAKAKVGEDAFIGEIARLGHGMQRGFLVAILKELVASEQKGGPKLLLGFEEPELYQHPPQAQHMQSMLERLAEPANNSQVIVTSHSPYFVSSKGFTNIRMCRKCGKRPYSVVKSTDYTKVENRITKAFGRKTQSPTSLMATVGQIMQTSQKELFFSPVVVLVEGEEDVAFIATHLNLTDEWKTFRQNGCHLVVAGGKNNLPRLVAIAKEEFRRSRVEQGTR